MCVYSLSMECVDTMSSAVAKRGEKLTNLTYQLQEHARASIIIPLLLRSCLRKDWIVPFYLSSLKKIIPDVCPIDYIVRVFARIAKNNTVLLSHKISSSDCKKLPQIIRNARYGLHRLLEAAAEMPP